jgi:hypothetical protein
MGFLEKAEERIEASVSGLFSKLSKAELQPVEISQAVRVAMDQAATATDPDRVLAPHRYLLLVCANDAERVTPAIIAAIRSEVARHATRQGYQLTGELELSLRVDPKISRGQIKVGAAKVETQVAWSPSVVFNGQRIELGVGKLTFGRDASADVMIEDRGLSRIHFEIAWTGGLAAIRDLESTNGSFVDGIRTSEIVLRSGSTITAGRTEFLFELSAKAVGE